MVVQVVQVVQLVHWSEFTWWSRCTPFRSRNQISAKKWLLREPLLFLTEDNWMTLTFCQVIILLYTSSRLTKSSTLLSAAVLASRIYTSPLSLKTYWYIFSNMDPLGAVCNLCDIFQKSGCRKMWGYSKKKPSVWILTTNAGARVQEDKVEEGGVY